MTLNLTMASHDDLKPRITVFGVGGAGGNAVNNMIAKQLEGVEFVVANTDAQALSQSAAPSRVQMGVKVTEGLGAGAKAHIGAAAAEESIEEIVDHLAGAHMCFITAGMGGGTGTGATPIIAQAARELGVLTVGVVTKPFQFEGPRRMRQAEEGIEALQKMVDTLIIIPNQNLFRLANEKTTCTDAFSIADDVLYQGVKGVTDLMVRPGLINLDFADVRAVMDEMGKAMMGTGEAEGEDRAPQAAEKAIANPLLDEVSLHGAKGVLINVTGGDDLTLYELDEAANVIREKVDPDANIIVGSTLDPEMNGKMRVSVVATGIDASHDVAETPMPRRSMAQPIARPEQKAEKEEDPASLFDERPAPARQPIAASTRPQTTRPAPSDVVDEDDDFFGDWDRARRDREAAQAEAPAQPQPQQDPRAARARPTPEVMARLEAATRHTPDAPRTAAPQRPAAAGPAPTASRAAEPRPAAPAEKPRFGINSLINRMGGHETSSGGSAGGHESGSERASAAAAARRRAPAMPRYEEEAEQSAEDRIEIPAFLRRQAN